MKLFLLSLFVATVWAAPQYNPQYYPQSYGQRPFVPITSQINEINPDGSYRHSYTTGDGQAVEETGYVKNIGSGYGANNVKGSYSYTSPEGIPIRVTYVADEFGFRPEGAHLPQSIRNPLNYQQNYNQPTYRPSIQPYRPYGRY